MNIFKTKESIFMFPQNERHGLVITTNGMTKQNGCAVMGKGIALEADKAFHLSGTLGKKLSESGNHCYNMGIHSYSGNMFHIITFPTKNNWRYISSISLIIQSVKELISIADELGLERVFMPPVGCGCGGLSWDFQVQPLLELYLDDRFTIILRDIKED